MGGSVAGGDRMSAEDRQVNNPIRDSSFSMGVHVLPMFRGWTVDVRLREVRMMKRDEGMMFVPFDSADGQELLADYLHSLE